MRRQDGAATTSPPWYPAPKGGTAKSWEEAYRKAAELVGGLSLVEKALTPIGTGWAMGPCVGNTGPVPGKFPSLCLQDGPLGVRFADLITAFPAGITAGSTWNRDLIRRRGAAMAAEQKAKGVNVLLGPSMGALGKFPAGGRNWEGFGSDPYLQGVASYEAITGIQSQGVIATAKHWVANEQEHFRQGVDAISSNIDDRTMHEIYMWPFADSVKAEVGSVMCSYNKVNNSAACQNAYLQNGLLKDELGFQGFIMSDWGAQMSGVASVLAGMDMTMPGDGIDWDQRNSLLGPELTKAVLNSSVPMDRLDDMVTRIVATWYKLGQDSGYPEPNFSSWSKDDTGFIYWGSGEAPIGVINQHIDVRADHASLAREIAAEGTVLLKNDRNTLPLQQPMKIGVYGEDAILIDGNPNLCPDRGCNRGTLMMGWGSGTVDINDPKEPLAEIRAKAATYGGVVEAVTDNNDIAAISSSAKKQDVCIVFINAAAGEGYLSWENVYGDRPNLDAQKNGDNVVIAVANNCDNTIVVVHSVGPVVMEKWVTKRQVRSILWANLPGQESGSSLVDILWGDVNPSGKLPYTIGRSLEDYGPGAQILYESNNGNRPQQDFEDGLFIDYRYFDREKIQPRYEFGFGLSYTTFSYSPITITKLRPFTSHPSPRPPPESTPPEYNSTIPPVDSTHPPGSFTPINRLIYPYLPAGSSITPGPYPYPDGYTTPPPLSPAGGAQGGNPSLWDPLLRVSFTLTNTGPVAGAEVAQLYVVPPTDSGVVMPVRQLRGFEKVFLQPGESRVVEMELTRREVSFWDIEGQSWRVPVPGVGVTVGESSRKGHGRGFVYLDRE
ncbi:glycoside hydrolase family 3 protein [Ascodesmis nigricans]|uniref:beta-glucosidase n=1 Tax=Ascodesmis nigricans TaxID=341454 RepID=A0A4S2MM49_9PEZI|nr:glycoside hydrolase family 3 protein [Ascodesmis nigricans]